MAKNEIIQQFFEGERALYGTHDAYIKDSVFGEGESPLKESSDLEIEGTLFRWKYPLWYGKNITVKNSVWFEMARAGVWYTDHVLVEDSLIEAPKNFRRCKDLVLKNVSFPDAAETLWNCDDVKLENVLAKGDYFAMGCSNMSIDGLDLYGNYSFDGVKNMTITNSKLLSKDAFWNTDNVTVKNSFISGEYLGWNAKNLTFIDCTIESLQGLCYIENLKLVNCKLINTTLAFEYSTGIDADITTRIDSIVNPSQGIIRAPQIDQVILDPDKVDVSKVQIVTGENR